MDVAEGVVGKEGAYDISFEGGQITLTAGSVHASGSVSLVIKEDAVYFANLLLKKIGLSDAVIATVDGVIQLIK